MPVITSLKPQKNANRVNVYLDGKFAFGLDLGNFVKANLKVNRELTEKQAQDLIFKNEFQKLYDRCLRLISARPRSEKEIRDYLTKNLKKKNLPNRVTAVTLVEKKLILEILKKLERQKLLNDHVFTVWWVEQRNTFRPRGKRGLLFELRQKGVDPKLAEKIIEETVDELALVKQLLAKKLKLTKVPKFPKDPKSRKKLTAFLARRGFGWEAIKKALEETDQKG